MSDPLLGYRTSTDPAPLQASTPGTPALGRINLAVGPGQDDTYCDRIQIAVAADDKAGGAYFTKQPNFSTSRDTWTVDSVMEMSGDELGLSGGRYYRATFHSAEEEYDLVDYTVDFGLSGTLSASTGPLFYYIQEHSGTSPGRGGYTDRRETLTLTVTEPVFYLHNFLARASGNATAPQTQFSSGSPVYLTWESNGGWYRLYSGDGKLVQEGKQTFCSLDHGVSMDTTFTLVASMSPETQGGHGFEPIYRYATLALSVPDPTLQKLTVRGDITAQAGISAGGNLSVGGSATVSGKATVGSDLTVQQSLTTQGDLTVDRNATVYGSTTARGWVEVYGSLTADSSATVKGELTTQSDLAVNGDLTAYGYVTAIGDGKYVRIRELRGPIYEHLHINSSVDVLDGCDVSIKETLDVAKDIKRAGYGVISHDDKIGLHNTHYPGWLYATMFVNDNRRQTAVWNPNQRVVESYWTISRD
jgi:cytoskeletal protein CcmA (bactofilin family)